MRGASTTDIVMPSFPLLSLMLLKIRTELACCALPLLFSKKKRLPFEKHFVEIRGVNLNLMASLNFRDAPLVLEQKAVKKHLA